MSETVIRMLNPHAFCEVLHNVVDKTVPGQNAKMFKKIAILAKT